MIARPPILIERGAGRLWSLWDMLKVNAEAFYSATTSLSQALASLVHNEDKYITRHEDGSISYSVVSDTVRASLLSRAKELQSSLLTLGAPITSIAVHEYLIELQGDGSIFYNDLKSKFTDIKNSLRRELSIVNLYSLGKTEAAFFDPKDPIFGKEFEIKFPSAVFELEEAAKCFALGRNTASVFHLMRIMEIGIRAVARCLGIPDPLKPADRNWGNVLKAIKADLDTRTGSAPTKSWANHGDREFFESAYTSLDAVRVGWRNTTMHVENKYTDEEAEHIFIAVRGFMKKLSSRMDEAGAPLA